MYADVHLHLYEAGEPKKVVGEALEEGVNFLITAGENMETSRRCVELSVLEGVHAEVGIHPAAANNPYDVKELEKLLESPKVVGIGEVGMDAKYERFGVSIDRQRRVFLDMIRLAKEYDLPVSIHSGRSYREVAEIVVKSGVRAHFHWYSGSVSLAVELAESGHLFSLGPAVIHYKNYRGLVELLPLESIATETDFPVRIGGVENHPLRVKEVVRTIAEIKGLDEEKVKKTVYKNALSFFRVRV